MFLKPAFTVRYLAAFILGSALTIFMAGCETPPAKPPPQLNPPEVRLGPVLDLLKVSTTQDIVRVVSSTSDQVHVLIASKALKQVIDITIGLNGMVEEQVVRSDCSPSTMDATLDGQGQLHILMDAEHWVLKDQKWRESAPTIWQEAGITVERPGFVHGAPQLVWTFTAFGKDIGSMPERRVWRGAGGGYPAGGFLIYPWHEQTRKAVLVVDGAGGASPWNVLDPQSPSDTLIVDAQSDAAGTIHLVYATGDNVDLADTVSLLSGVVTRKAGRFLLHYVRKQIKDLQTATPNPSNPLKKLDKVQLLRGITGSRQLDWPYTHTRLPLAVDPVTGSALIGDRWLVKGDHWTEVMNSSSVFPMGSPPEKISATENDNFDAITIGNIDQRFLGRTGIKYSRFSKGEWSAPLWLSVAGTLSLLDPPLVDMASTGNGNTFVVWSTAHGIVGRWVEHLQKISP